MRYFLLIGIGAGIVFAVAAASAQDDNDKAMQIFRARKCTQCHSIAGVGNKKGALDDVGSKLTAEDIRAWIVDPEGMRAKTQPPPTRKPFMKKVSMPSGEIDALVNMLKDLKAK